MVTKRVAWVGAILLAMTMIRMQPAGAEEEPPNEAKAARTLPKNVIYTDPLDTALSKAIAGVWRASLGYERTLGANVSLALEGFVGSGSDRDFTVTAYGGKLKPRFYDGAAPTGFFLAPFVLVGHSSGTAQSADTTVTAATLAYSVGASIGHAWLIGPVLIRFDAGVQYAHLQVAANYSDGSQVALGENGWRPVLDFEVGFAF